MKFLKLLFMGIIILTIIYYGSSYLFDHLEPPLMNLEKESITRPDTSKGGKSNPGIPGTTKGTSGTTSESSETAPSQEKSDLTEEPTNKGTVPETIKPVEDLAKAKQIVFDRFSKGDLVVLRNLAKNGLTEEEKSKALAIIRSRLTKEEYELLYHKYYLPYVKNKINN